MPKQRLVLRIFVGSPSDVADERTLLEEVVREWNKTHANQQGVQLELVRWETDTYPSVGVDPQDVINNQINDDYDIFLGIMWCRFGKKTGRAESGTEEEFLRAKAKFDSDPTSMQIMVYFKDAPISPSAIDPDQVSAVKRFQASLGDKGIYWWSFSERDQFAQLLRLHITNQVYAWAKRAQPEQTAQVVTIVPISATPDPTDDEDVGIMDLLEASEDSFAQMGEILERISAAQNELTTNFDSATQEIQSLGAPSPDREYRREAKRVLSRSAADMNAFVARIRPEIKLFRNSFEAAINFSTRAILEMSNSNLTENYREDTQRNLEQMITLQPTLKQSARAVRQFRDSAQSTPRLTGDLNKAKRALVSVLDEQITEFTNAEQLVEAAVRSIRTQLDLD